LGEEVAKLEQDRDHALITAQRRGAWIAGGMAGGLVSAGGYMWIRARRARFRELAALQDRIARDLHDELGSHLGSITLMSGMAMRPGNDPAAAMADVNRLSREAAASMRGIIWLVREEGRPPLTRLGAALRQVADLILRGCDSTIRIEGTPPTAAAGLDVHRHVYLFFREAAHNIARHAKAVNVTVELTWGDRHLVLAITDDGQGFDPAGVVPGSGLANLRHRAEQLRGTVTIDSVPGAGTRIRLEAPLI
jgi:signal transduction histidine kinase